MFTNFPTTGGAYDATADGYLVTEKRKGLVAELKSGEQVGLADSSRFVGFIEAAGKIFGSEGCLTTHW